MKKLLPPILAVALLLTICTSAVAEGDGMRFSDALVSYIMQEECFLATPKNDGAGWYIGYGFACDPADWPDGITEEAAEELLRNKLDALARDVNGFLDRYGVTATQGQFDALCAMSYNFGSGWLNPANRLPSYLIRGLENYTEQQIASAFGAWCHVNGQVSEKLLHRRLMELNMFLYEDYSFTYDGWTWLLLNAGGGEQESDIAVYRAGEPYRVLPAATREGWDLAGWRKAGGALLDADEIAAAPLRVTAIWSASPEVLAAATEPVVETIDMFPDVEATAWYASDVEYLGELGILSGYEDGTFRPSDPVTWGEALKLVLRAAGFQTQLPPAGAHWADGYRTYAVKRNYLKYSDVRDLNRVITRDEIADLCAASLELPLDRTDPVSMTGLTALLPLMGKGDRLPQAQVLEDPFADTERESVLALYEAGVLRGGVAEDGRLVFRGADAISRAELSAILVRMMDYVNEFFVFVSGERAAINFGLRLNPYDPSAFHAGEDGRLHYTDETGTYVSRCGVDVSYYQGEIDWERVAADGVDFAMIRCGYRGYGAEGTLHADVRFRENIEGALAAGLDVGVYFFSQALTVEEALEEAALTLELIDGYNITFPVVFDWERVSSPVSRSAAPDWDAVADCTDAYLGAIAAAGYTPMAYFNKHMSYLQIDMERAQSYDGWFAWYHNRMDYIYDFQIWQYSDAGRVAGIEGNVDMNICLVRYPKTS